MFEPRYYAQVRNGEYIDITVGSPKEENLREGDNFFEIDERAKWAIMRSVVIQGFLDNLEKNK